MIRAPRCPYCHEGVSRGDPLVVCRECHAFHHDPCFREGAGCAACLRRGLGEALPGKRLRRLTGAAAVFAGFLVGQVVGTSVTIATRTSEHTEPSAVQRCPLCCPRHHHDCH